MLDRYFIIISCRFYKRLRLEDHYFIITSRRLSNILPSATVGSSSFCRTLKKACHVNRRLFELLSDAEKGLVSSHMNRSFF